MYMVMIKIVLLVAVHPLFLSLYYEQFKRLRGIEK